MKVAIVCDWLTNVGGAEKVLLEFHKLFPDAPIYTSKYDKKKIDWFNDATVKTGWLQIFPTSLRRFLGPLRQLYFSHLNLSKYDVIISVTGAEAKSVKKGRALHFCYCHVPTQYYWGMYDDYVKNPGFGILNPIVRFFFKLFVGPLRHADFKASKRPDYFITISEHAKEQIKTYYHRDAIVIHPNVDVENFEHAKPLVDDTKVSESFIVTSRQVNWKRLDLAVAACIKAGEPLIVIGEGPEHAQLVKLAGDSELITFLPLMQQSELASYLKSAKGFIFPSMEPFGIAPVEALAAGCPVVAYGKGGALDYIKDGENGLLFDKQTSASLAEALTKFSQTKFNRATITKSAAAFSTKRFDQEVMEFVNEKTR